MGGAALYARLPALTVQAIAGLALCFLGGRCALLIAAFEVFRAVGWGRSRRRCACCAPTSRRSRRSAANDREDADGDGVVDMAQISADQLFMRKLALVARTCDPAAVSRALGCVVAGSAAVLAALQVDFAKTVARGHSVAEHLQRPVLNLFVPTLSHLLPRSYHQWIPVVVHAVCKELAISIACALQAVLSVVQSAVHGGILCSRGVLRQLATPAPLCSPRYPSAHIPHPP